MLNPAVDWTSDPNFVIVDGVPILDEHELVLPSEGDGKPPTRINVDAALLARIAANNNRRVAETGDTALLIEGHTTDDTPEPQQPEIVGEADNFRVAPLFNTGRQAIWARFKFRKTPGVLQKLKNNRFPRRSVELWTDKWEIDPIALLGPSAPERDLGVLRLHRIGGRSIEEGGRVRYELVTISRPVHYASNSMFPPTQTPAQTPLASAQPPAVGGGGVMPNAPMVDPGLLAGVMGGVQQTDTWQQMVAMQQQTQQMLQQLMPLVQLLGPLLGAGGGAPGMGVVGAPPAPGGGMPGMAGGMPGGDMGGMDPMMLMALMGMGGMDGMGGPGQNQRDEGDRVRMDGASPGSSYPSATNTFLPGMGGQRRNPRYPYMSQQYSHNGHTAALPGQVPTPQLTPQIPAVVPQQQEHPAAVLVRLQRENQELRQENAQLRVVMELNALQNEGVILDPNEEFPLLVNQPDEVRALMYQRMRQRYQRRGQSPGRNNLLQQLMQGQQVAQLPGQAVPQAPGQIPPPVPQTPVPNAPGTAQPVPLQYQRAERPGVPQREAPPNADEHERVIQLLCQARDNNQEMTYDEAVRVVRYGRSGRNVREQTY